MIVVEAKVGSSAGGVAPGPDSHHPERSGALRSFAPTGHRHTAETAAGAGPDRRPRSRVQGFHFSATAVEAVRGVLVTAHCFLREDVEEKRLWQVYRGAYGAEPFVRLVKERRVSIATQSRRSSAAAISAMSASRWTARPGGWWRSPPSTT